MRTLRNDDTWFRFIERKPEVISLAFELLRYVLEHDVLSEYVLRYLKDIEPEFSGKLMKLVTEYRVFTKDSVGKE